MLRSFLIGLVAGQRGMSPLAVIAIGIRRGIIPPDTPLQTLLRNAVRAAGSITLAAAEMAGDKMETAPDRIVPSTSRGPASRLTTPPPKPRPPRVHERSLFLTLADAHEKLETL